MQDELKAIIAKYDILHDSSPGVRCRCIEGAKGHLLADIVNHLTGNYILTPRSNNPQSNQLAATLTTTDNPPVFIQLPQPRTGTSYACRFHPTDWWHEVGCKHRTWSTDDLNKAITQAQYAVASFGVAALPRLKDLTQQLLAKRSDND